MPSSCWMPCSFSQFCLRYIVCSKNLSCTSQWFARLPFLLQIFVLLDHVRTIRTRLLDVKLYSDSWTSCSIYERWVLFLFLMEFFSNWHLLIYLFDLASLSLLPHVHICLPVRLCLVSKWGRAISHINTVNGGLLCSATVQLSLLYRHAHIHAYLCGYDGA